MHQNLKNHLDQAFLLWQKVYIYITNTKRPWDELPMKEREDKKFKWTCVKLFVLSNKPISKKDVEEHMKTCPETYEYVEGTNKNGFDLNPNNWKPCSVWYDIYPPFPLTEYDAKLLINTVGLRMCHFINARKES